MDGAHDMGGMHGFGPVRPELHEPVFHADWERRALALTLAMAKPGGWNIDMSRSAREDRPADDYFGKSYYEIWLSALERLMVKRDLVSPEELATGRMVVPPRDVPILRAEAVEATLRLGGPTDRRATVPPRFSVGDRVRARNMTKPTHTRLPRYVRGHVGTVGIVHGTHVFPDTHALEAGEQPHWVYTVIFDGRDLWGGDRDPRDRISVDAWEPYLEPTDGE